MSPFDPRRTDSYIPAVGIGGMVTIAPPGYPGSIGGPGYVTTLYIDIAWAMFRIDTASLWWEC